MLVVLVLMFLAYEINCNSIILPNNEENERELVNCIKDIVEKYYVNESTLTYLDLNRDDSKFLVALNESPTILVRYRKPGEKMKGVNEGYFINAENIINFLMYFETLQREAYWNPSARFVIIIQKLDDVVKIFNKLHKLHVINAIVINGTNQADIYTYNPYENFACGRYFDRIISYGTCVSPLVSDFFPNKLKTGLRNCILDVAVSHIPPFTYNPNLCKLAVKTFCKGVEQYALEMLSELEHFRVNFSYVDFAQNFSSVDENMTAVGYLSMIQKNETDGILGFTILSANRSEAFNYIYQYLVFTDRFVYIVKRSDLVPVWKMLYLEFQFSVWIVILLVFVLSVSLILFMTKPKNKAVLLLNMWDSLFLHGFNVSCHNIGVKFFLLIWVQFAFLVNCFYQSSLMSLTTHPSKDFQIATEDDLIQARLQPCVQPAIVEFLNAFAGMNITYNYNEDCRRYLFTMKTVSLSYKMYTIVPYSLYIYNAALFHSDERELYLFTNPVMNSIYALYLHKGFPWTAQLEIRALQLRENGLIDRFAENILHYNMILNMKRKKKKNFIARPVVPWGLLLLSTGIATFIFILEVLGKKNTNTDVIESL